MLPTMRRTNEPGGNPIECDSTVFRASQSGVTRISSTLGERVGLDKDTTYYRDAVGADKRLNRGFDLQARESGSSGDSAGAVAGVAVNVFFDHGQALRGNPSADESDVTDRCVTGRVGPFEIMCVEPGHARSPPSRRARVSRWEGANAGAVAMRAAIASVLVRCNDLTAYRGGREAGDIYTDEAWAKPFGMAVARLYPVVDGSGGDSPKLGGGGYGLKVSHGFAPKCRNEKNRVK